MARNSDSDEHEHLPSRVLAPLAARARFGPMALFGAIQAGLILSAIWLWRPSAPFRDEWFTVDIVRSFDSGTLTWLQLWALHNEHRIVLPRLLNLGVIEVTAWNRQVESSLNVVIGVATALLLVQSARTALPTFATDKKVAGCVALLVLSLSQYENWMLPFQIAFTGTVFGVAMSVRAITQPGHTRRNLAIALAGALIASFSSSTGLLAWVVFLPSMVVRGRLWIVAWAGVATVTIVPYLVGFHTVTTNRGSFRLVTGFIAAYIGSPLLGIPSGRGPSGQSIVLGCAGMMLMGAYLAAAISSGRRIKDLLVWLELAAFAAGCGAITALGRVTASGGMSQAMTSRYQSFSMLWWVALLVVMCLAASKQRLSTNRGRTFRRVSVRLNAIMLPCILGALLIENGMGVYAGVLFQTDQLAKQHCIVHYRTASDACLLYFIQPASLVRDRAPYLAERHLAVFAGRQ